MTDEKKYVCKLCNYSTDMLGNWKKHLATKKHKTCLEKKEAFDINKQFYCKCCNYSTSKSNSWQRHINSKKHISTFQEPSIPYWSLVALVDTEDITNERIKTQELSLEINSLSDYLKEKGNISFSNNDTQNQINQFSQNDPNNKSKPQFKKYCTHCHLNNHSSLDVTNFKENVKTVLLHLNHLPLHSINILKDEIILKTETLLEIVTSAPTVLTVKEVTVILEPLITILVKTIITFKTIIPTDLDLLIIQGDVKIVV